MEFEKKMCSKKPVSKRWTSIVELNTSGKRMEFESKNK